MILAAVFMTAGVSAQVQITTKKEKLSDFTVRIMKVVMSGNGFVDLALQEAINNTWSLSPFEFCTVEEFNALKTDEEYYFLIPVKVKFKEEKSAGVMMLDLVKGKEGATDVNDMLEVASMPICAADVPSGREAAMLPGIVDAIQGYVGKSLQGSFSGIGSYSRPLSKMSAHKAVIADSDLAFQPDSATVAKLYRKGLSIVTDEKADSLFMAGVPDTIVSYTVAPDEPSKGSFCWKMLIDARTHELYFYSRNKISSSSCAGFSKGDLSKIAKSL